jgi:hypothetical protein
MWLDPRLVEELTRLPCLVDAKKQAARDQAIFDKFYLLDKPQLNMDWEGIRQKRVLQHLADANTSERIRLALERTACSDP